MSNIEIEFQSATYPQHSRQTLTRHGSPTSTLICFHSCAHASSSQFHLAYVSEIPIKIADCKTFSLGAGSGCPLPRQTSSVSPQHRISNCAFRGETIVTDCSRVMRDVLEHEFLFLDRRPSSTDFPEYESAAFSFIESSLTSRRS